MTIKIVQGIPLMSTPNKLGLYPLHPEDYAGEGPKEIMESLLNKAIGILRAQKPGDIGYSAFEYMPHVFQTPELTMNSVDTTIATIQFVIGDMDDKILSLDGANEQFDKHITFRAKIMSTYQLTAWARLHKTGVITGAAALRYGDSQSRYRLTLEHGGARYVWRQTDYYTHVVENAIINEFLVITKGEWVLTLMHYFRQQMAHNYTPKAHEILEGLLANIANKNSTEPLGEHDAHAWSLMVVDHKRGKFTFEGVFDDAEKYMKTMSEYVRLLYKSKPVTA